MNLNLLAGALALGTTAVAMVVMVAVDLAMAFIGG
jgi:hypothetical protein